MGHVYGPYFCELKRSMEYIAKRKNTIFLGQCVGYDGNALYKTICDIDASKRLEMPVMEEVQLGCSVGLALNGFIPVTIYPRINFLLLAMNQLVNHLDKLSVLTSGKISPKVIIRTCIGSEKILHPGVQHAGDYTEVFKSGLTNTVVVRLDEPEQIFPAYKKALERSGPTLLIEWGDYYDSK